MNYYIADMHLGHQNVIAFDNRPFQNVDEMDRELIRRWNQRVNENDHVYIVGDFCFRSKNTSAWYLHQLKGRKHLIQGKNTDEVQDMLWREREINWNDFPTDCKRGSCAYKVIQETEMPDPRNPEQMIRVKRRKWVVDHQIPIFTQDRNFVEQWL